MLAEFFQGFLPLIFTELGYAVAIFIPTISFVYMSGRMLNILISNVSRNLLAIITNYGLAVFYIHYFIGYESTQEFIWFILFRGGLGIVLYVLVGFKLFGRIDNLLDKKLASDQSETKTKKKRK